METLSRVLDTELRASKVLKLEARGLVISLRESGFFASGEDVVSPASFPTLEKIADVIQDLPNPVRLEGHTDSIPIHNSRFRSNWPPSLARAIAMLEILATRYQIPRARMAVAGYAENAAADTNETDEGRAHNPRGRCSAAHRRRPAQRTAWSTVERQGLTRPANLYDRVYRARRFKHQVAVQDHLEVGARAQHHVLIAGKQDPNQSAGSSPADRGAGQSLVMAPTVAPIPAPSITMRPSADLPLPSTLPSSPVGRATPTCA